MMRSAELRLRTSFAAAFEVWMPITREVSVDFDTRNPEFLARLRKFSFVQELSTTSRHGRPIALERIVGILSREKR